MKAFFATTLLATSGLAAKHSLMSYDKSSNHLTLKTRDDATTYYRGWLTYSTNDIYVSATQPVDWTDDSTGIYFEQLGLFEASSVNTLYLTPNTDYFGITFVLIFYPFSFAFFDNVLTVTLGSLADLTSADGFSVCDTLGWYYDILKLSIGFTIDNYEWADSIYDTIFNSDNTSSTYVADPSTDGTTSYDISDDLLTRSFISRSGWFGFNNCDDTDATYPW